VEEDVAWAQPVGGQGVDYTIGLVGGGGHLVSPDRVVAEGHDVGEGAAYIHPDDTGRLISLGGQWQ
jgi:hypothetical protein